MATQKGKLKRSFYYYDINLMKYDSGKLINIDKQEETFYEIFNHIKTIQNKYKNKPLKSHQLEVSIDNGDKIYIIVDQCDKQYPIEFRLILCRINAFPLIENNGVLNFITNYLPKDTSLAEITHCVIFPQYNIMGAEYNFYGARPTAIKSYLPLIYPKIDYVYCSNKLNDKVVEKLNKNEKFSLFSLSIKNDSRAMSDLMNRHSIFKLPFTEISDVDTFEITLKRRKTKSHQGFDSPIPIENMDGFIKEYREDIKKFKVSQGSVHRDLVDLLSDKLVNISQLTKTTNNSINSEEAYRIIEDFFNEKVKLS